MTHVDSPTLDALAASRTISPRASLHIDGCVDCRRGAVERGVSGETIAANAAAARERGGRYRGGVIIAACLAVAIAALPLRGTALGFISVFEPHTVAAVPLTLDEMRGLGQMSDLSAYASTRELRTSASGSFSDVRSAAAAAGFALREPTDVPTGIRAVSYAVTSPSGQLITFASHPKSANAGGAPLPADIAGSTLRVDIGSTVVATYETAATVADRERMIRAMEHMDAEAESRHGIGARSTSTLPVAPRTSMASAGRVINGRVGESAGSGEQPRVVAVGMSTRDGSSTSRSHGWMISGGAHAGIPLVVVQMPVPHIASTGVSVQRIMSYMLNAPGVPPRVAAAFGALGDLSTTLPIPVPIDKAFTQPVIVDGVGGVGIGDDTGLGAAVIWQKNGMLYAVFATKPAPQVLAIANSLR